MARAPRIVAFALLAWTAGCSNCGAAPNATIDGNQTDAECDGKADGMACTLWWEPCVDDAVCKNGACRSALAEAESPGQLRWSDAGPYPVGTSFTVDSAGNSTFAAGSIYSLDACGQLR